MLYDEEARSSYENEMCCILCKLEINNTNLDGIEKVRHHCHFTGRYIGAAHSKCNILARRTKYFPVICQNMTYIYF